MFVLTPKLPRSEGPPTALESSRNGRTPRTGNYDHDRDVSDGSRNFQSIAITRAAVTRSSKLCETSCSPLCLRPKPRIFSHISLKRIGGTQCPALFRAVLAAFSFIPSFNADGLPRTGSSTRWGSHLTKKKPAKQQRHSVFSSAFETFA